MVEVKTILNQNLIKKFNADQAKSKVWFVFALTAIFFALGIVCFFVKVIDNFYGVFLIIVGLLLPVIYFLTVRILMNRTLKSSPILKNETTQVWRFLDDKIIFNESGKYVEARDTQFSYEAIHKVEENETAFYIYVSKMQAYIIDAKGFNMGSRHDLHRLLLDKVGSKKYKYSKRLYAKK